MATLQSTVDFITSQIDNGGMMTSRKMFGEYALYCEGKIVAFICDDSLFLKPTPEAKEFFSLFIDAPAYPGSKMYMLVPSEKWEDREFMSSLITITYEALPKANPKKVKYQKDRQYLFNFQML